MRDRISQFFKKYFKDIVLFVGVVLVSLLSFAAGYIAASQDKQLEIHQNEESKNSHHWSRSVRPLSGLEARRERG